MTAYTTAQVAEKFETDARTLRKFLRSDAASAEGSTPGKGSRYAIEGKELASLKKRFKAWSSADAERRATTKATKAEAEVTPEEATREHLQGMGIDRDPTDEELDAMAEVLAQGDDDDLELDD